MSRITNYEAVAIVRRSRFSPALLTSAFDRQNRSIRVSNQVSHIVAALLPKIPWCGPGAGLAFKVTRKL